MTFINHLKFAFAIVVGSILAVPASAQLSNISDSISLQISFLGSTETQSFNTPEPNFVGLGGFNYYQPSGASAIAGAMFEESGDMVEGQTSEFLQPGQLPSGPPLYPSVTADVQTSFVIQDPGIYSYLFFGAGSITVGGQVSNFGITYQPATAWTWTGYLSSGTQVSVDTGTTVDEYQPIGGTEFIFEDQAAATPEPSMMSLGLGIIGLTWAERRRSKR